MPIVTGVNQYTNFITWFINLNLSCNWKL